MSLNLKSASETRYDAIALGEVMMRIDPGQVPTARARNARIWHGGRDERSGGTELLLWVARRGCDGSRRRWNRSEYRKSTARSGVRYIAYRLV